MANGQIQWKKGKGCRSTFFFSKFVVLLDVGSINVHGSIFVQTGFVFVYLDLPFFLEFVIRSFIRYFVQRVQRIGEAKYLIKLRITNSKKRIEW